jgi:cyclopropane-fatty-acyl-phospholipid synthase
MYWPESEAQSARPCREQSSVLESLVQKHFPEGELLVRLPDRKVIGVNGAREETAPIIVAITDNAVVGNLMRNADLALGESFMSGGLVIERGTLYDFLLLVMRNRSEVVADKGLLSTLRKAFGAANARAASRKNVARHYDLSGELFSLFLDADRQYSCAYFAEPGMDLEAAQRAKKHHIAAKLRLEPGHGVLDIGSGWGGLGITLAEDYGADVTGVTLSTEQLTEARKRAAARDLSDKVKFELRDYRDVEGPFDRIVSVGMFEHVGAPHYQTFFDGLARLLKPDGVALLHTIGNTGPPIPISSWLDKHIFPGGHIPSLSEIAPAIERARLIITDIEVLRLHYAETLRIWRERFMANRERAKALYDERFCRMWEFYLTASEAAYRIGRSVIYQIQLARSVSAIPLTRDYITEADRAAQF